jgi:hypothetical protein
MQNNTSSPKPAQSITNATFKKLISTAKQKRVGTDIVPMLHKHSEKFDASMQEFIQHIFPSLVCILKPYGFSVCQTGGVSKIVKSVASTSSISDSKIYRLDDSNYLSNNKSFIVRDYLSSHYAMPIKLYITEFIPFSLFQAYAVARFIMKADSITAQSFSFHNRNIASLERLVPDRQLLSLIAYMFKIGLIDINIITPTPNVLALVDGLKNGISDVRARNIADSDVDIDDKKIDIRVHPLNLNPFSSLLKSAYKIRYVSGQNGKHLTHKSPIAHTRSGHWHTLRNGQLKYYPEILVNSNNAEFQLSNVA